LTQIETETRHAWTARTAIRGSTWTTRTGPGPPLGSGPLERPRAGADRHRPRAGPSPACPPLASGTPTAPLAGPDPTRISEEVARTVPARENGGNHDIKNFTRARIFHPMHAHGALFSAGDLHFGQGDGEITFCGAIEMGGFLLSAACGRTAGA
jgi:formamidase